MADPTPEQIQEVTRVIEAAFQDAAVPKLYANGFHLGQSPSDVFIVPLLGGKPLAIQYISFATAKTLMLNLQSMIRKLEKQTKQRVLSTDDIQQRMAPVELPK